MAVLENPRHEIFAREVAKGASNRDAYTAAGYEPGTQRSMDASASKLLTEPKVQARIKEIQEAAAKRAGITVENVLLELKKIGFADIRKAVRWSNTERDATGVDPDDPQGEGGQIRIENEVLLVPSAELDEETAAAIAEVSQGRSGLKIKFHDKRAALVDMGRHLGMFTDKVEHSGPDGGPVQFQKIERVLVDPK